MSTATASDGLRIVQLHISAFKGISVADITPPESGVVVVSGKNGAGKSSLMDAIAVALGGGPENRRIVKPVKLGSTFSQVVVDLGDLIVTRQWDEESTWLKVTGADGSEKRSPQRLLNSMLGKLSFDPGEFLNQTPAKQRDMLLAATGLGHDVARIDAARREATDERLLINREIKRLTTELSTLTEPDPATPSDEVTVAELVATIRETERSNSQILNARNRIDELDESIADTERRIAQMRESLDIQRFERDELKEIASASTVDVTSLEDQVADINTTNARIRAARRFRDLQGHIAERKATVTHFERTLADLDARKAAVLASADLPVAGLSVDDNGITFGGVPFNDANTASRLQTATAIAMALNPTIRIIRITDGSLLDRDNLTALHDLAADKGYQVWVERVDDGDDADNGIIIRDGSVVANNYQDH